MTLKLTGCGIPKAVSAAQSAAEAKAKGRRERVRVKAKTQCEGVRDDSFTRESSPPPPSSPLSHWSDGGFTTALLRGNAGPQKNIVPDVGLLLERTDGSGDEIYRRIESNQGIIEFTYMDCPYICLI